MTWDDPHRAKNLAGSQPDALPAELCGINGRQRGPDHEPSRAYLPARNLEYG
jgi:hypothetical protein